MSQDLKELERQYRAAVARGLLPGVPPPRKPSERLWELTTAMREAVAMARAEVQMPKQGELKTRALRALAVRLEELAREVGDFARDLEDEQR